MRNSTIDIQPMTGAVGAEIFGVDLAQPLGEGTYTEIRQAFNQYGVLFFRDQQHITPEQYMAFGERFGELEICKVMPRLAGYEKIEELRKEPEQRTANGEWHTDQIFRDTPSTATMLMGREIPPHGGDTLFISMAKAYEALSEGLKRTLETLRAVHSQAQILAKVGADLNDPRFRNVAAANSIATHPVVLTHPETGRKALFVNPGNTVRFEGWTEAESAPLLSFLHQHAQRPEYGCRFRWREGSIAFWDNRQTLHYATNDYDGYRRVMHRMLVA